MKVEDFESKYPELLCRVEEEISSAVSAILLKYPQLKELVQWGVEMYVNDNNPTKSNVKAYIYQVK